MFSTTRGGGYKWGRGLGCGQLVLGDIITQRTSFFFIGCSIFGLGARPRTRPQTPPLKVKNASSALKATFWSCQSPTLYFLLLKCPGPGDTWVPNDRLLSYNYKLHYISKHMICNLRMIFDFKRKREWMQRTRLKCLFWKMDSHWEYCSPCCHYFATNKVAYYSTHKKNN